MLAKHGKSVKKLQSIDRDRLGLSIDVPLAHQDIGRAP
jgi:hypothetical protein